MDRPPENADPAEIARFLEEEFWEQVSKEVEMIVEGKADDSSDKSYEGEEKK